MADSPLYIEIYLDILSKIKEKVYIENSPLPSERDLCSIYHVSRSTIRQAILELYKSDMVYKVHGSGTFIKPSTFEQPLYKFYSFTDELLKNNITIYNNIISFDIVEVDDKLCSILKAPKGDLFHKIVRLRTVENSSVMVEATYLPKNRFFKIDLSSISEGSLYNYLKSKYSLNITKATETFKPTLPANWQADLLDISSKMPCTLLERYSYEGDDLVEYTYSIVRGDKYTFTVNLIN